MLTYTAPTRPPTRCAGGTPRSTSRASARASSASRARPSRGARSAARSARATGPPAPRRSTSTATSPTPSSATRPRPATRTSSATSASSCSWRPRGSGARSAITTPQGRFRIDGVTGPDEYSAIADNNVYTNLMAQRNLRAAAEAVARHPRGAAALGADLEEAAAWRDAAEADGDPLGRGARGPPAVRGLHPPPVWDFEHTRPEQYPLLLHFPYFDLYRNRSSSRPTSCWRCTLRRCVHRRGEGEELRLLRSTHRPRLLAVGLHSGRDGRRGRALDSPTTTSREAGADRPRRPRAEHRDGLHIASLAGALVAAVAGFGGMRDYGGKLTFAPRLPDRLERLAFRLLFRGRRLSIEATKRRRPTRCSTGRRSRSPTTARRSPSRRGSRDGGDPGCGGRGPDANPAQGACACTPWR